MLSTLDTMDLATSSQSASAELKETPTRFRSPDHVFTLGIEEELQIIDPETRDGKSLHFALS
ncbi:MAG TPA: hypothetical protein VKD89_02170 [Candidatus Udaeobacter sp.]|nr:hypothetical protein [Candidatus Udaeobacter sp.]